MAIAQDGSTPALAPPNAAGTTVTSNAFSPPAGSLLVVTYPSNYGYTITGISDSLATHLTYRKLVGAVLDEDCEIWVADCPSAQTNMTVTATVSSSLPANESTLGVVVVTGTKPAAQQTGATASNSQYSGAPSCGVTTTADGSLVIGVVNFPNSTAAPSVPSGQTATFQTIGGGSGWWQITTAPVATTGTLVTISDITPTGDHGIVAAEILAATGGGSVTNPLTLAATSTSTASLARQAGKVAAAGSSSAVTVARSVGKSASAVSSSGISLLRSSAKSLASNSTGAASVGTLKVILRTLTAASTATATVVRLTGRTLGASASSVLTLARGTLKALGVATTGTASAAKQAAKAFAATSSSGVTLARGISKTFSVATGLASAILATVKRVFGANPHVYPIAVDLALTPMVADDAAVTVMQANDGAVTTMLGTDMLL